MPFGKISYAPQSRIQGRGPFSRPRPMPAPISGETSGFAKGGKIAKKKPKVSTEYEMDMPGGASMEMEVPKKYAGGGTVSRGAGAAQRGYDYKVYAKGGSVCRGMGSATKGGKYSIK